MSDVESKDTLSVSALSDSIKPNDQRFKSLIQELFSLVQELFAENDNLKESVSHAKSLEDQIQSQQERIDSLEEALRLLASSQLNADTVTQMHTKIRRLVSDVLQTPKDITDTHIELDSMKDPE